MARKKDLNFSMQDFAIRVPQVGLEEDETGAAPSRTSSSRSRRIEYVAVTDILPDEFQPRIQLPTEIARLFFSRQIDCFEAASRWMDLADQDELYHQKLKGLFSLQESLDRQGQIKPATGAWLPSEQGATYFYLETGERRFWATVFDAVRKGDTGAHIVLGVINQKEPNPERQAEENERVESLTAVGRAREIARLILYYGGIHPQVGADYGFCGFHRQALQYDRTEEMWQRLQSITGLGRTRMSQILQILKLPDAVLEIADAYNISSRELYQIVRLPADQRDASLQALILKYKSRESADSFELDEDESDQPLAVVQPENTGLRKARQQAEPAVKAARKFRSIARTLPRIRRSSSDAEGAVATELFAILETEEDIERTAKFLMEVGKGLLTRLEANKE